MHGIVGRAWCHDRHNMYQYTQINDLLTCNIKIIVHSKAIVTGLSMQHVPASSKGQSSLKYALVSSSVRMSQRPD